MCRTTKLLLMLCGAIGAGVPAAPGAPLRKAESSNARFLLEVRPGRLGMEATRGCKATLYDRGEGRPRPRWSRYLANDAAPELAVVRDDGRFVVTLDEYQRGGARHAVVIYGERGELLRHFLLSDLLGPADWEHVRKSARKIEWLPGAEVAFDPQRDEFEIVLRHGRKIRIDLRTLTIVGSASGQTAREIPSELSALLFDGEDGTAELDEPVLAGIETPAEESAATDAAAELSAAADQAATEPDVPSAEFIEPPSADEASAAHLQEEALEAADEIAMGAEAEQQAGEHLAGDDEPVAVAAADEFEVPQPSLDEPVDYVAWLRSLAVTDGPSAVPYYQAAMDNFVAWDGAPELFDAALAGDPDALAAPEFQAWLAANRESINQYRSATEFAYRGMPCQSEDNRLISVLLPHLTQMRTLAKATVAQGKYYESAGDPTAAAERYLDVVAAGAQNGAAPTLIENLVGIAVQQLGSQALLDLQASAQADQVDYAALAERLEQRFGPIESTKHGLQGERAMLLDTTQHVFRRDPATGTEVLDVRQLQQILTLVSPGGGTDTGGVLDQVRGAMEMGQFAAAGFDRSVAEANEYYDELTRRMSQPYPVAREQISDFEGTLQTATNPLLRRLTPSLAHAHFVQTRAETGRRAVRLSTQLRAYRQTHGRYPDSLDVFGDADYVIDPFTEAPFHYQPGDNDFLLYSAGGDGVDDGGVHDPKAQTNDYVFWPRPPR